MQNVKFWVKKYFDNGETKAAQKSILQVTIEIQLTNNSQTFVFHTITVKFALLKKRLR